MISLSYITPLPRMLENLLDTVLLSIIIFPVLVFFMLKPMTAYLNAQKKAESELRAAYEKEQYARRTAEILSTASLALTKSLDPEKVANTLVEYMSQLIPYDAAHVLLLESEKLLATRAANAAGLKSTSCFQMEITHNPSEHPIFRQIIEKNDYVLIDEIKENKENMFPYDCLGTGSYLAIPLIAENHVHGFCGLYKNTTGFFTPEYIQVAEALVHQASVTIQNTWLFDQVRSSRSRLQTLSRRLVEIQENERKYISRELHDEAGQSLTLLLVGLNLLEKSIHDKEAVQNEIQGLKQLIQQISENLHNLAMDLRPSSLDHLGLISALEIYGKGISQKYSLEVNFKAVGLPKDRLKQDLETTLYRIAQEGLTNIVKHAKATRVDVLLERRDGSILLIIEDNGLGFDPEQALSTDRLGLLGIRERADMYQGSLTIESKPGSGTTLVVELPYVYSNINC
jgi:signal transduction histidine kinase